MPLTDRQTEIANRILRPSTLAPSDRAAQVRLWGRLAFSLELANSTAPLRLTMRLARDAGLCEREARRHSAALRQT